MGDNDKKSQETLAQERLERYKADPNKFVELGEMIVCVIRTSDAGPAVYIKGSKPELQIAWAELNQRIMTAISRMTMEAALKNKPKLFKPPASFLEGLRRRR